MSQPLDVTIKRLGKDADVRFILHFFADEHALTIEQLQVLLKNIIHALDKFSPEADTEDD